MGDLRDRGRGGLDWWCALPDTEATAPATLLLSGVGDVLARHACGRPWIIGQYRSQAVHLFDIGPMRIAVLGECLADITRLAKRTDGGVDQLMTAFLSLPGSIHIVIVGPAGLVATGDVAGFRRLFTAKMDGVVLVASHAERAARHTEPLHRSDTGAARSPHPDHWP